MIEETIRSFLAERLDVPVRLSVPTPAPARVVGVEKTGSGYEDGIHSATIAVQSYGPAATSHDGTLDAAKLNELATYLLEKETITGEEFMEILNRGEEQNQNQNQESVNA